MSVIDLNLRVDVEEKEEEVVKLDSEILSRCVECFLDLVKIWFDFNVLLKEYIFCGEDLGVLWKNIYIF